MLSSGYRLQIDMVSQEETTDSFASPACRLIYCALVMRLLVLYSHRRSQAHNFPPSATISPPFLGPVFSLASYLLHVQSIRALLQTIQRHCSAAGLPSELLYFYPLLEDGIRLFELLGSTELPKAKMGGHAKLSIGE
jgi:hypothetical protein